MKRERVLSLVAAALAPSLAAAAITVPAGFYSRPQLRVALADGRHLNLACLGEGSPVVILDGGAGLPSQVWMRVQPLIAQTNRVCVIDRPGYGFSDPGPLPRTAVRSADDIAAALKAAGLKGPFVLVGHSRAGYDVRQFAARYPRQTAGLVLVDVNAEPILWGKGPDRLSLKAEDPTALAEGRRCMTAAAEGRLRPTDPDFQSCGSPSPGSDAADPNKARAVMSELDNVDADGLAMAKVRVSQRLPIIVLTADVRKKGVPAERAQTEQSDINRAHAAMAAQSRRGEHRYVDGAGHIIMYDRPDIVAQAVRDVIARSASSR